MFFLAPKHPAGNHASIPGNPEAAPSCMTSYTLCFHLTTDIIIQLRKYIFISVSPLQKFLVPQRICFNPCIIISCFLWTKTIIHTYTGSISSDRRIHVTGCTHRNIFSSSERKNILQIVCIIRCHTTIKSNIDPCLFQKPDCP